MKIELKPLLAKATEFGVVTLADSFLEEFTRNILSGARRIKDSVVSDNILIQATLGHILKQFERLVGHITSCASGDRAVVNMSIGLDAFLPHPFHKGLRDVRPTALQV